MFAWITPTGRCNLYCTHCPIRSVPKIPDDAPDMSLEVIEHIVRDVVPTLETVKIGGNNNGEAVLARNFDEFYARIQRPGLRPWIITNGTLLRPDQIDRLGGRRRGHRLLDGRRHRGWPQAHPRTRLREPDGEHPRCRRGPRSPRRDRRTVQQSPTVFLDNLLDMPDVVQMALELRLDGVRMSNLMPQTEAQRYQSLVYHRAEANRVFEECRKLADGASLTLITPAVFEVPAMKTNSKVKLEVPARDPCIHPWTSVSIDEKGLVHPCCVSDQVLGDLSKDSFATIWNGRRYRKLRRKVNSSNPPLYCRRCVLRGSTGATLRRKPRIRTCWRRSAPRARSIRSSR